MNRFAQQFLGLVLFLGFWAVVDHVRANQTAFSTIGAEYTHSVRPVMKEFCLDCHSTAMRLGELDLEQFAKLSDVRRSTKVWIKVAEMLDNGEMPPKSAKQPSTLQRKQITVWIKRYLEAEAQANAGDPGPVVLRRLNNAQYTYTVRDLTGLELDPTREFPTDSAAGEGFTNTGGSLVMSPALLTKYLDAGKEIAKHAELLPDGFRFSPSTTRSDWTNDALSQIRNFYRERTDSAGSSQVNLQGLVFETNEGGRLPLERYLKATLIEREALRSGTKTIPTVAKEQGLNAKYLGILWATLNDRKPSLLLDSVRAKWRAATAWDFTLLTATIRQWQNVLFRFNSIGHLGAEGGPKAWQEPVVPTIPRKQVRLKLPSAQDQKELKLYLVARDAGDGNVDDFAVWQQPRLVAPGRPDLLLRDIPEFMHEMTALREHLLQSTAKVLNVVSDLGRQSDALDVSSLAQNYGVDIAPLTAWLGYLGISSKETIKVDHLTKKQTSVSNYSFVNGWGSPQTPFLIANSSNDRVRIPGNMKPHGICAHPSKALSAAVAWQSPIAGVVQVEGKVTPANPECGNGVTWSLELHRGATVQRLGSSIVQGNKESIIRPIQKLPVQPGDLVALVIGPRDGDSSCDLTDLELVLKSLGDNTREWSLTRDVSDDVLAANPHADGFGNKEVWHFYSEPVKEIDADPGIPAGSLLARWLGAEQAGEKRELALALQNLLTNGPVAERGEKDPDTALYRQLTSLGGPLLMRAWPQIAAERRDAGAYTKNRQNDFGLDPAMFGSAHPRCPSIDEASLCVQAPSTIEVRLPSELTVGAEFVTVGTLHPETGLEGSAQLQVLTSAPSASGVTADAPIVAKQGSAAFKRFERAFDDFRGVFPAALCYAKIVPVDEAVTLTLFHREDEPLRRLMLSAKEAQRLDRLWDELHFVSQDALTLVNAYEQITEFATQDRPDMVIALKPLRKSIDDRAAAFRESLVEAEPRQIDSLIDFAARAYRRPLTAADADKLRKLYRTLRDEGLPHDEAFRFTLAGVFAAPEFLYRIEKAPVGVISSGVSDFELANRLSYFLWSSIPDDSLDVAADAGTLRQPQVLVKQARRMLADGRVRRLATEFACQWLHIYDFDSLDEKSEKYFPEFAAIRGDMYEESIRFFTDLFQRDASVLTLFNADHTFVNERLAKFYGILDVTGGDWRRIDGLQKYGRGGILGLSTTLAKQSGASRTSPILRGNWVSEVLLGEKLPRPPKNVPQLPEDEIGTAGLTVRQLVARHTSDAKCSSCHQKIDPFGFSLEEFDAIGRRRDSDLAGRALDTKTRLPDGSEIDGLSGLRDYLVQTRRDAVVRQFCRKLLGFALGRSTQLADDPLLAEMQNQLAKNGYRFSAAVQTIVQSRQFLEIRGTAHAPD